MLRNGNCKNVLPFIMNSFKPGLVSKNYEVAVWASRLMSRLSLEIAQEKEEKALSKYGWKY